MIVTVSVQLIPKRFFRFNLKVGTFNFVFRCIHLFPCFVRRLCYIVFDVVLESL